MTFTKCLSVLNRVNPVFKHITKPLSKPFSLYPAFYLNIVRREHFHGIKQGLENTYLLKLINCLVKDREVQ